MKNILLIQIYFHFYNFIKPYNQNVFSPTLKMIINRVAHSLSKEQLNKRSGDSSETMDKDDRKCLQLSNAKPHDQKDTSRRIASSEEINSSDYPFQISTH